MQQLGLVPTKNSGSGWVEKADGQNDYVICELKSSEKASIGVKWADIAKLEEQAIVSQKLPVFAIQDLTNNETYVIVKPEILQEVAKYLKTGKVDGSAAINKAMATPVQVQTRAKKKIGVPKPEDYTGKYKKPETRAY